MPTQGHPRDVVVLSGKRTGFGTFGGSLKDFTATDLGMISSAAAIEAAGISADQVDHTFFGNALQTSADAIYLARHVALRAGVPQEKGALTVNRLCGSGFEAIVQGAKEIILGEANVCLTGGAESMSQAPHVLRGARFGNLRLGPASEGFEDLLWESLSDTHCDLTMAQTAEELADRYDVQREEVRPGRGNFPAACQRCMGCRSFQSGDHARHDQDQEGQSNLRDGRAYASRDDVGGARRATPVLQERRLGHCW